MSYITTSKLRTARFRFFRTNYGFVIKFFKLQVAVVWSD